MSDKYLFPRRLTRRDFLQTSAAAGAAWSLSNLAHAADGTAEPVKIGEGKWTYTLDPTWGQLPAGMKYGLGCAVVVDSQDRVYVTSRSVNPCVAIFDRDGKLLETWSNDFAEKVGYTAQQVASTAHGLYWSKEPDGEFFYFTENKPGSRVYKTDLSGKVLYEIGKEVKQGSASAPFEFVNPTDVAVAPNGDIYVVDGYGSQLVHRFDKNFKLIKTMGGPGTEHGKFKTCHGVWISTLGKEPEVYIADRTNGRLEVYSLDLDYKRTIPDMRAPCCFYQHAGHLYIPELGSRVTIIDANDKVVAHLGDGKGIKKEEIPADKFTTPHAMTVDSQGNFYIVEWIDYGRVRKFRHTPSA
ncbi:MAG: twin-arginine translocation signal domain-containing protein [Planctomycetes bacterium]|nr:twin-arginine translocation signal domain-containing protein [Planctomycetota bacterium]